MLGVDRTVAMVGMRVGWTASLNTANTARAHGTPFLLPITRRFPYNPSTDRPPVTPNTRTHLKVRIARRTISLDHNHPGFARGLSSPGLA